MRRALLKSGGPFVVLFAVDVAAGVVLLPGQSGPLRRRQIAVGLQAILPGLDSALLRLQVIGFPRGQLAGLDPLLEALLLALLPGIDFRVVAKLPKVSLPGPPRLVVAVFAFLDPEPGQLLSITRMTYRSCEGTASCAPTVKKKRQSE